MNNLGWLIQKDDPNRALTMVALANKISPESAYIADTLGWLKYQRKDHEGALPLLQRAHDIDTASAPISYHLALALDATGKRAEAKSLLKATLEKSKFDGSDDAARVEDLVAFSDNRICDREIRRARRASGVLRSGCPASRILDRSVGDFGRAAILQQL